MPRETNGRGTGGGYRGGYRGGVLGFDNDRPFRYFRNSVDRFRNTNEVGFEEDRENLIEAYDGVGDEATVRVSS